MDADTEIVFIISCGNRISTLRVMTEDIGALDNLAGFGAEEFRRQEAVDPRAGIEEIGGHGLTGVEIPIAFGESGGVGVVGGVEHGAAFTGPQKRRPNRCGVRPFGDGDDFPVPGDLEHDPMLLDGAQLLGAMGLELGDADGDWRLVLGHGSGVEKTISLENGLRKFWRGSHDLVWRATKSPPRFRRAAGLAGADASYRIRPCVRS